MANKKSIDRHQESPMEVYPLRCPADDLRWTRLTAKKLERTRQSIIRQALRELRERMGEP